MGGGKSYALCAEAILLSLDYPGNFGYIARKTFESLRKTTMRTFFELCPDELIKKHNQSEHLVTLINGSQIQFGDLESIDKLKSLNLGFFAIDEASEVPKAIFLILASRLRLKIKNIRYFGLLATNPEPCWLKEDFVMNPQKDFIFVRSLPTDNSHLPEDYVARLRATADEDWIKRYLEGDWGTFEGQIYKDFNRERNVIETFAIPSGWNKYRTIDLGVNDPTACLWIATDPEKNVYIYKEYYQSNRATEEHAEDICMMSSKENYHGTIFDHHGLGKQLIIDYARLGVRGTEHKEHKIIAGIARVQELLKPQGFANKPKLFIFNTCPNTIREIETYRWDTRKMDIDLNSKEKALDRDNHCVVGDTLIWTTEGKKKIKDMVGTTGWLYTPYGIYPYRNVRKTGHKLVTEYDFEGSKLITTSNHKIQTSNGEWKELFYIQSDNVVQLTYDYTNNIRNNPRVRWDSLLSMWRKILPSQYKRTQTFAPTSGGLGVPPWKHPYGLPYSPQGWEYGEQSNREFRYDKSWDSFERAYDAREKEESLGNYDKVRYASSKSVAQNRGRTQVSQKDIKNVMGPEGKSGGSVPILWEIIQNIFSKSRKVLSFQLSSKNISRTRSLTESKELNYQDVYDLEVGGVHCFVVNDGFVIRNCMDCLKNWTVTFYYAKTPTGEELEEMKTKQREKMMQSKQTSSITGY